MGLGRVGKEGVEYPLTPSISDRLATTKARDDDRLVTGRPTGQGGPIGRGERPTGRERVRTRGLLAPSATWSVRNLI